METKVIFKNLKLNYVQVRREKNSTYSLDLSLKEEDFEKDIDLGFLMTIYSPNEISLEMSEIYFNSKHNDLYYEDLCDLADDLIFCFEVFMSEEIKRFCESVEYKNIESKYFCSKHFYLSIDDIEISNKSELRETITKALEEEQEKYNFLGLN